MQQSNKPVEVYGYPVRNYAPALPYPQSHGGQCASSTKPASGKSFTIEALLAKPEERISGRASPTQCRVKYQPSVPALPLSGHATLGPVPYFYGPNISHSNIHAQPGYSVYCCPPFAYQSSCRGAFYTQGTFLRTGTQIEDFKKWQWDETCLFSSL